MSDVGAGPVTERERIQELDVLRGVALFGVLTMNFVAFAGPGVLATEAQLAALPTARLDEGVRFAVQWLIGDKANTMFATLFGLGFYLQMQRGEGRPGFEARYARRLGWLLVFGWVNMVFLWPWDILNLYGLAGFLLLAMRRWRTRSLLIFGVLAACYSDKLQNWLNGYVHVFADTGFLYEDAAALARQQTAVHGDYPALVGAFWNYTYSEWLAGGLMAGLTLYALGRFALGACIGRSGILDDVPRFLPLLRKIAWIALPLGLALALAVRLLAEEMWSPLGNAEISSTVGEILRSPAALLLAAGYSAAVVVALHKGRAARLFAPIRTGRAHGADQLSGAGFPLRIRPVWRRPGPRPRRRHRRGLGAADLHRLLRLPDRVQPLVARPLPLRPDGMAVAGAHLWRAPLLPRRTCRTRDCRLTVFQAVKATPPPAPGCHARAARATCRLRAPTRPYSVR